MAVVSLTLPPLIRAMLEPGFYPHKPDSVELRQTHISYALLAGDHVYKIKKPVRFPFLDYSGLEQRRHFCFEEVRLNRRLAPTVYLDVIAIVKKKKQFSFGDSRDKVDGICEYAVVMRRLSEDRFLDRLLRDGNARPADLNPIAEKLAGFYAAAPTDRASYYGSPELIRSNLEKTLQEAEPYIGESLTADEFRSIQRYQDHFLTENRNLMMTRAKEGRVREGHGDLRAEHICLEPEPVIFDCIEFNEEFRYCDAASEIAFLAMDLDFLGAPMPAEHFVASFQDLTNDPDLLRLLPLYKSYRACVRGKVETLKSREPEVSEEERLDAKRRARRYFHLAHRYASGPCPPALAIVCGMAGSGKSTVARSLGARTGYQILNSDVVRKQLAGISLTTRSTEEYGEGLYSESFNERTYDALLRKAEECLKAGTGVIVDATFQDPGHRRQFVELATRLQLPLLFVECRATEQKIIDRLTKRRQTPGAVSDATVEVYLRQRDEFVPLTEIPESIRLIVSAEDDPETASGEVFHSLRRILLSSGKSFRLSTS
jgi:aminoglycoside phosphotransferase family enzyme/predicted kinase